MNKLNLQQIVQEMRSTNNKKKICEKENDILAKCILCKKYLSSNQYGPLLEKFLKNKLNLLSPLDNTSGDGRTTDNKMIEIKVSLGDTKGKFSFVQLRPDHNIDYYVLLAYDLNYGKLGNVYIFNIPSDKMNKIIIKYGGYAHGTIKKLGKINENNIKGRNCEYVIRVHPNKKYKSNKIWEELIKNYLCTLDNITFS